jgi:gliding motility-associated-like protein
MLGVFFNQTLFKNQYALRSMLVFCFLLAGITLTIAEGTKELMPNPSIGHGYIQIYDRGRLFATYNSPKEDRLNIKICNIGEVINLGFNQSDNDVYFRLKDPNGNMVLPAQAVPTSGQGFIPNYAAAVAGPNTVNPAGYTPITYTTTMTGDYYIEFNPGSATVINNDQRIFTYFDITVTNNLNIIPGRLWSLRWDINTNNVNNRFYGKMFIYSKDSIVTSVDFNGLQPHGATITANSSGLSNTGNVVNDRVSRVGDFSYPEYKIFLNNPDENCFPTGFFGNITRPSTISGCGNNRCINVEVNKPGEIELLLDLNGIPGFQPNSADIIRIIHVQQGMNCIPWDAKNNLGENVATNVSFPIQINYINGITHLPLYDVEHHTKGYIVELIRPAGNRPNLYWDDASLNAGSALDNRINLNGCSNNTGCHRWQNRGNNNCNSECPETINTWWYPNIITDNIQFIAVDVTIDAETRNTPGAINDTLICSSNLQFQLSGMAQGNGVAGVQWIGGSGNFIGGRSIRNPIYEPTLAEKNVGNILLYFETIPFTSGCLSKRDSIFIRFEKIPAVQLPSDSILCSSNQQVFLEAVSISGNNYQWSGGNGGYSNQYSSSTYYTPAMNELTSTIQLTLTSYGEVCNPSSDQIQLSYLPLPQIHVADTVRLCPTQMISVTANVMNSSLTEWYTGSTILSTSNQLLYSPSISQYVYVRAANSLGCAIIDSVHFLIVPLSSITIEDTIKICQNQSVLLSASIADSSPIQWMRNNTLLSTSNTFSYNPVVSEYIYVRSLNMLNCPTYDSIYVEVFSIPMVSIPDIQTCIVSGNTLDATPTNLPLSGLVFEWYKDGVFLNLNTPIIDLSDFGLYEVKVKNQLCEVVDQSIVSIFNRPVSNLPDSYIYCEDDVVGITITAGTNSAYLYEWYPNVGNTPSVMVQAPGWYRVKISESLDCYVWDSILVQSICEPKLHTPNAFTPNSDGNNDRFIIYGKHIGNYKLIIFNRWGEIIYESNSIHDVWDGMYLGNEMPIGTYPWIIEYEGDSEKYKGPYRLDGSVTLVK